MLIFVFGAASSGKSQYAEQLAGVLGKNPLYIATMQPWDNECRRRIERHRNQRAGRGFHTMECYGDLSALNITEEHTVVLLEDVGNLVANLLYSEAWCPQTVIERAVDGILRILEKSKHMIVVSNEVFADSATLSSEMLIYSSLMGELSCKISQLSDITVRVICGIPLPLKGGALLPNESNQ